MEILRLWLFANDGVTENAKKMLIENNILWSTRENLDGLLKYLNLSKLPEL